MKGEAHLIVGEEDYLVESKAKEIVSRLLGQADPFFALETVDGRAYGQDEACQAVRKCIEALGTVGFFEGRKVVWFRNVCFLADSPLTRAAAVQDALTLLAERVRKGLPSDVNLVVTAPAADGRSSFFRTFSQHGNLHDLRSPDVPWTAAKERAARVAAIAKQHGLEMSEEALHVFLERVGDDLMTVAAELEKLALGIAPSKQPGAEDVKRYVTGSPAALIWDLGDAIGSRALSKAFSILDTLLSHKESPIGIVVVLQNQIREWLVYREALDNGWLHGEGEGGGRPMWRWGDLPERVAGIFRSTLKKDPRDAKPFRVSRLAQQASNFSIEELRRMHTELARAHEDLVFSRLPPDFILEMALLRMIS